MSILLFWRLSADVLGSFQALPSGCVYALAGSRSLDLLIWMLGAHRFVNLDVLEAQIRQF